MKPISLVVVTIIVSCVMGLTDGDVLGGSAASSGEKIVRTTCVQCHRIEGKPAPRRTKQAPDLIWAGQVSIRVAHRLAPESGIQTLPRGL